MMHLQTFIKFHALSKLFKGLDVEHYTFDQRKKTFSSIKLQITT